MKGPWRTSVGGVDFAKLYAELGVAPDCGLDRFKQAYRRRVAGLHPDRPGSRGDPDLLVALNLGYSAALDFHRGHGRLPGALATHGPRTSADHDVQEAPRAASLHAAGGPGPGFQSAGPGMPRPRLPGLRVLTLPVLLLVLAAWLWLPTVEPPPASTATTPTLGGMQAAHAAPGEAQLGMDRRTVAALVGEPVARSADDSHWIYGPSWLSFECDRLADWYSSPLRPLRVGSRTPDPRDRDRRHRRDKVCPLPPDLPASRARGSA